MKHTLLTLIIAILTGVGGYFIGKNDLISRLKLEPIQSSNTPKTENSAPMKSTEVIPKAFTATTLIQINPHGRKSSSINSSSMMTRQFFQTQFATIQNEETIGRAIADYKLDTLFQSNRAALQAMILASLELQQERGTDLIRIEVSADTLEKAQQISYAIATSYGSLRSEYLEKTRAEVMAKYKRKIEIQTNNVEDLRKKLFHLSKKLGIPYLGINSAANEPAPAQSGKKLSADEHTTFGKIKDDYEREFMILQSIKSANLEESIVAGLETDPIRYHKKGWTPKIEKFMKERKQNLQPEKKLSR